MAPFNEQRRERVYHPAAPVHYVTVHDVLPEDPQFQEKRDPRANEGVVVEVHVEVHPDLREFQPLELQRN